MFATSTLSPDPTRLARMTSTGDDECSLAKRLMLALDLAGHGMLLLTDGARVLHANRPARQALGSQHPLTIEGGRLLARSEEDRVLLAEALQAAVQRGLRHMLHLGPAGRRVAVAVLPIDDEGTGATLVTLEQPSRLQNLAVQAWGRHYRLTCAELGVLEGLLVGQLPSDIARAKGVALSTVRTQIGQLRLKTGAASIRQLLDRLAALPPMLAVVQ